MVKSADGWIACKVCGHANKPHWNASYNACARCYHDAETGEFSVFQALTGWGVLGAVYFFCALIAMFLVLLAVQLPLAILELERGGVARTMVMLVASVFMLMGFGLFIETWFDPGRPAIWWIIGGLAALGALGGWIYNVQARGPSRAG